jgi:hypothetical protein
VASGASRLADPARRETIVSAAAAAIAARTGSDAEVRVTANSAASAGRLIADLVPGAVRVLVPA